MFEYFDLLSGKPIEVAGVGHFRSPRLRDIAPGGKVSYRVYNFYLNFLLWDKEKLVQYDKMLGVRVADRLLKEEKITTYDAITLLPQTRELCRDVLSFFMSEELAWVASGRKFATYTAEDTEQNAVGEINRDNFEKVRTMILQLNYIGLDQGSANIKHTSAHSKELWEKAQYYLKKQTESQTKEDKPEYHLGNIISKLCSAHPSYNISNVWNLTVFQLYDAFFQYGYIRYSDLNETIFGNHGGEKFNFEDWLKPILNNV